MNQLKVNQQQTIVALRQQGWSKRKIARELGLDRVTVRKYLAAAAKSPTPQTGSDVAHPPKSPAHPHTGSPPGPVSQCEPWRAQIARRRGHEHFEMRLETQHGVGAQSALSSRAASSSCLSSVIRTLTPVPSSSTNSAGADGGGSSAGTKPSEGAALAWRCRQLHKVV